MRTEGLNIKDINETVLEIVVEQMYTNQLDFDRDLNLTWNVTEYAGNSLIIQLYFLNPMSISID